MLIWMSMSSDLFPTEISHAYFRLLREPIIVLSHPIAITSLLARPNAKIRVQIDSETVELGLGPFQDLP